MSSTPTPKAIEPHNARIARADEQLARAHEQITRAGEDLARLSEQVAKMEPDAARPPLTEASPQSPPRNPALRALVGLPLAACIVVAALVLQWSYGGGAKLDGVSGGLSDYIPNRELYLWPRSEPASLAKVRMALAERGRPRTAYPISRRPKGRSPTSLQRTPAPALRWQAGAAYQTAARSLKFIY